METIFVNAENCDKVAHDLLLRLIGYNLKIISFYTNSDTLEWPKILNDLKVTGDIFSQDGHVRIRLTPNRNIIWDISAGKVTIAFMDEGDIVIQRMIGQKKAIQRVITLLPLTPQSLVPR